MWVAWVRGYVGAWVHGWCGGCGSKSMSGVDQNFGMGGVGLKRFVQKLLLKVSQHLQESTCAGVSCKIRLQAEGLQIY